MHHGSQQSGGTKGASVVELPSTSSGRGVVSPPSSCSFSVKTTSQRRSTWHEGCEGRQKHMFMHTSMADHSQQLCTPQRSIPSYSHSLSDRSGHQCRQRCHSGDPIAALLPPPITRGTEWGAVVLYQTQLRLYTLDKVKHTPNIARHDYLA